MNKHNISEDEIIRDWSFSQTDLALINKFNKEYRLWIASQIGSLKLFGQFLNNPNELASEIIAYICRQVKMPITVTISIPQRDGTRTEHKKVIFNHLGFSKFNDAQNVFHAWIRNQVDNGIILVDQIVSKAEVFLIENKIAVPTEYKLKREINSIFHNRRV